MKRSNPRSDARSFGSQIEQLCTEKGLRKQELADRAKISPAQLSHYLRNGTSVAMMERIASSVDVNPDYFDSYVIKDSWRTIAENKELLEFIRDLRGSLRASQVAASSSLLSKSGPKRGHKKPS